MKELSLNILDIAENSVKAQASLIKIEIEETEEKLVLSVTDNGCGMTAEALRNVTNPFYTTGTTRRVGLGIPLLKSAAEQTGGSLTVTSRHQTRFPDSHGTRITAFFYKKHIDYTPMGDIISTVTTLIQGSPNIDFAFRHQASGLEVLLDTRQMREILGADIPLNSPEILQWIARYLKEQYKNIITNEERN